MPYDRRPSANSGRSQRPGRPGRPAAAGKSDARRSTGRTPPARKGGTADTPRDRPGRDRPGRGAAGEPRRYGTDGRRTGPARRDPRATPVDDRGDRPRRSDRVPPRRVVAPKTAAQIRSAEVKAARGVREPRQTPEPPPWEREKWVDEGPLRSAARKATERAQRADPPEEPARPNRRRKSLDLAPHVAEDLQRRAPAARAAKYQERLASAAEALDRGRFDDARRMVQPVLRDLPDMAFGHEIAGLAMYRAGQWRKAAAELELARQLDGTLDHHAVLADCYRALKRYDVVEQLWLELREGSPAPDLMAEGRIVAAGALADQGDLKGALRLMERAAEMPKKVREHHLRQWYVLADLHDRSGDIIKARRLFGMIAEIDGQFADVADRLRGLGR